MLYTVISMGVLLIILYIGMNVLAIISGAAIYGINVTLDKLATMLIDEEREL